MAAMNNTSSSDQHWTFGRCQFDNHTTRFDAFLYIAIAVITACGNFIVFVCYSRHRALRNSTNVFIISLSSSDFLVAVLSIPYSFGVFLCQWRPPVDERSSDDVVYLICDMLPSILSIYSLCLVAIDRAIAITNPFFHTKYVNQRSAGISVLIMWCLVSSFVAFIYILDRNPFTLFIIFASYVIPVSVMVTCYSVIGYVARQHAKAINIMEKTSLRLVERNQADTKVLKEENHSSYTKANDADTDIEFNEDGGKKQLTIKGESQGTLIWLRKTFCRKLSQVVGISDTRDGLNLIRREFKAALTLSLLLGVFVISWTPFMALNMHMYRCPSCHINFDMVKYFKLLHYLNSALNPLLYIILNKRWRVAFQRTVCCVKQGARGSEATMTEMADW